MTKASRIVIQTLCLLSYLWASTCIANVLQMHQFNQQEPRTELIVDEDNGSLTVHHFGHRDQHEPQAQLSKTADSDHVVKLACFHHDLSAFVNQVSQAKVLVSDVLLAYLPSPTLNYTATAKTLLLAQQPPPSPVPAPISRNSSVSIVQLTRLHI